MTDILAFLPPTGRVSAWRFVASAFATPLLLGVGGAIFVVPAFAAVWGIWAYAILGLPMFWLAIRWFPGAVGRRNALPFVLAGFVANLGTYPLYLLFPELGGTGPGEAGEWAMFCAAFGLVFGPLNGLIFGWLYMVGTARGDRRSGVLEEFVLS